MSKPSLHEEAAVNEEAAPKRRMAGHSDCTSNPKEPAKGRKGKVSGTQRCSVCNAKQAKSGGKLMSCGKCRSVSYCSSECQHIDWKAHKPACKENAAAAAAKKAAGS